MQVARSLTERDRTLQSLATTLGVAGVLTILIAFGAGWALSGLTLQPIHRITQTAQEIGDERDFTRRVDYTGPPEEMADIVTDMVDDRDRLIRLVNDLLLLARADAGRSLAKEPLEIQPVLEETIRQARRWKSVCRIMVPAFPPIKWSMSSIVSITGKRVPLRRIWPGFANSQVAGGRDGGNDFN